MKFEDLNIIEPILRAIKEKGYTEATPIQEQGIKPLLLGNDILACAQTGTGKTATFAIPIIQKMHQEAKERGPIRSLILTPTRELAIQIRDNFREYGKYTNLKCSVIFGGVNQKSQIEVLKKGVDILVATPGRLLDLINQKHVKLSELDFLVLDEADRMLDMGFIHDIKRVMTHVPSKRQTLLFSATMPKSIETLAQNFLNNPVSITVTPVSSTVDKIDQFVYYVDKVNKPVLLVELLRKKEIESALVFTRTKHGANKLVKILLASGIKCSAIHGNKSQSARELALKGFKTGEIKVLVATDIASRGIDIKGLSHVFNYELPNVPEDYVHRIGRTGRAGKPGCAISLSDFSEKKYIKDIEKLIKQNIKVIYEHDYPITMNQVTLDKAVPKKFISNKSSQKNKKDYKPRYNEESNDSKKKKYYSSKQKNRSFNKSN